MSDLKCPSCGYEKRQMIIPKDTIITYKRGKRKGEIKEIHKEIVDVFKDDPEFIFLEFGHDVVMAEADIIWHRVSVQLYACPKCNTVIMKKP